MQAIHIRNVPSEVVEALKRRAKANHRSLQGELLVALEEAAAKAPPLEANPPLQLFLSEVEVQGSWPREALYDDEGR